MYNKHTLYVDYVQLTLLIHIWKVYKRRKTGKDWLHGMGLHMYFNWRNKFFRIFRFYRYPPGQNPQMTNEIKRAN